MESPIVSLFAVALLLAANGFFVAAEFALVTARGTRIESLADQGSASARMTMRLRTYMESYLAACQLGITMASLGLGWIGEPAVAALLSPLFEAAGMSEQLLHTVSFIIGFLVFSSLHIVVGEQVPKTFAIRKPEPVVLACAYLLHGFYRLVFPLNWLLNRASRGILSMFKVEEATHGEVYSTEELRELVTVSQAHGQMEAQKAEMLKNLFAFDERTVQRIMLPRTHCAVLDLEDSPEQIVGTIRETRHSRYPVVRGDHEKLIGILIVKDLWDAVLAGKPEPWTDLQAYVRKPIIVPETLKASRVFEITRAERTHMAIVLDEYGAFAGLITMEDLLEEIVGDIADERDPEAPKYSVLEIDSGWESHGLVPLADVERITGLSVPRDVDANTLSGLFRLRLERIPELGDESEEAGYLLSVTAVEDYHAKSVVIKKLPPQTAPSDPTEVKESPAGSADEE